MFLGNINQTRPSKVSLYDRRRERKEQRTALEKEVTRLRKSLAQELNLRNALYRGFHRALGSLPRIPNNLPVQTRKLLFEVAVLEEEVVSLEKQVFCLREQLQQDLSPTHSSQTIVGNFASKISTVLQNRELHTQPGVLARSSEKSSYRADIPVKHLIARITNLESHQTPALESLFDQATSHSKILTPKTPDVSPRVSSSYLEGLADMPGNGPTKPCAIKNEDSRHPSVTQTQLKSKDLVVAKMLSSVQGTETLRGRNRSTSEGSLQKRKPLNEIA